ncbi:MAG: hypothetical protein AMXMBFR7_04900 [Planctomycetota bacterium]
MWFSGVASMLGSIFFVAVQGTVFNFLLEDLGLLDKLGFFMGLSCLAGIGALTGAWIQERFAFRRGLFLWGIGASRLVWLVIGAIPLLWPDWKGAELQWPLAALVLLFVITHSMGANAWMSWMGDLIPPEWAGRYWGLRQVGTSAASALSRFGFGWFLDTHHHPQGYFIVFAFAVVVGVADALLFLGVVHRAPVRAPSNSNMFKDLVASLRSPNLRLLIGVYALWNLSNCVMGAAVFRFARLHVEMGIFDFSICELLALITYAIFSLLWGRMADHHGHRGPLIVCLLVHALCPIYYFFTGPGDFGLVTLGFVQGSLGFCGVFLFMWPMVIAYTTQKGRGRSVGIAAFTTLLGLPGFLAYWLTDDYLRPWLMDWTGAPGLDSPPVFLSLFALVMVLRFAAAGVALGLPAAETETPPGHLIRMFAQTNPLRAAMNMVRFVAVGSRAGEAGPFTEPARAEAGSACAPAAMPLRDPGKREAE